MNTVKTSTHGNCSGRDTCACAGCPARLSRRSFLAQAGIAAAGTLGFLAAPGTARAAGATAAKPRIRIVYALHAEKQDRPDWPNKGFDFVPVMDRINKELARACPEFEFVHSMASDEGQAGKILEADKAAGVDGYLVYQMNCWNRVIQPVAASGKPVLYADFQFAGSGGFLVYTADLLRRKAPNFGFVASSRMEDLVAAVKCFGKDASGGFAASTAQARMARTPEQGSLSVEKDALKILPVDECLRRMKEMKILAVRGPESGPAGEIMGIKVQHVPFAELNEAWKAADKDEALAVADQWQKAAAKVEGVTRETLETSAAMYLAQKAVMKKHGAGAITVNCLGGFYGGHIHAYPCLGFHQLLNEGLVGACECDVRSTASMVAMSTLTQGRPGYISDPVIDTSKRQIIYAHCVASNRAFGPQGGANPFEILTHSEDRQGASVRSIMPTGRMTTTVEFDHGRRQVLFHRAKAVANDPDDRACRTKLCAEPVGDMEKLFTMWDHWSWHRVTVYGDLKEPVFAMADAMGWKVVEEA